MKMPACCLMEALTFRDVKLGTNQRLRPRNVVSAMMECSPSVEKELEGNGTVDEAEWNNMLNDLMRRYI